jgi:malate dehydrogenase (oxaloacetate-decarboxylating)(NADP+)
LKWIEERNVQKDRHSKLQKETIEEFNDAALKYHSIQPPGKLALQATKPMNSPRDLALAYSPGVAVACEAIAKNASEVSTYTARGNLIGVISNGTAVLGLGAIGALASKPVMEGKAVLFKKFAGIDVFDIEIEERDPDKLVEIIAGLEATFGGINLEDIKAPECFEVEDKLKKRMNIPVFHDDQHGTAVVTAAAIVNGLEIVNKKLKDIKITVSGAGSAALACLDLLVAMGLCKENILIIDRTGVIFHGRSQAMESHKLKYAADTNARNLADAMQGADIFLGLSSGNILKPEMIQTMAERPLILALANPIPEIMPEEVKAVRADAVVATGRSDYPNQVNNVLCFPFIFRGALDVDATTINEEMKIASVYAIAALAKMQVPDEVVALYDNESLLFGSEYILPKPFDPRLLTDVSFAVAKAAMESGVARRPLINEVEYKEKLMNLIS